MAIRTMIESIGIHNYYRSRMIYFNQTTPEKWPLI